MASPRFPRAAPLSTILLLLSTLAAAGCLGPSDGQGPSPPEGLAPGPPPAIALERVAGGFESPVYATHAPGDAQHLYVVEQAGRVRVLDLATGDVRQEAFLDIRGRVTDEGNEQGLLSIAFAPDYQESGVFYVDYTSADRGGDTRRASPEGGTSSLDAGDTVVARFHAENGRGDPASEEQILTVDQPFANHNGGLLVFGPDGMLYVGLGDGGAGGDPQNNGQDPSTLLGTLLRIDVSGGRGTGYAVPPDNPFVGNDNLGARGEVWAFGLRNPWRFSFDRETGDLYIADVGQSSREEVNLQPAGSDGGENYGWNVWEGTKRFRPGEAVTEPVFPVAEYARDGGHCSVTGGHVYRGSGAPGLQGVYLYADYCSGTVWGLTRNGSAWESTRLLDTELRITSFAEGATGELYVLDRGGGVYRVVARGS